MQTFYRKVIRITAEDSPNVRRGQLQQKLGMPPDGRTVLEGVLSWDEFLQRLATWDEQQQCVGLWARFYEGKEVKLIPRDWLRHTVALSDNLVAGRDPLAGLLPASSSGSRPFAHGPSSRNMSSRNGPGKPARGRVRTAKGVGIDPAEGGDDTTMTAVDEWGVIEQVSKKTPDTNVVVGETLEFMFRHGCPPSGVVFDRGGGGKQHADRIRGEYGYPVRSVGFGEAPTLGLKDYKVSTEERIEAREERYAYRYLRDQMYWELRELMDPVRALAGEGFGIPGELGELLRQLAAIPRQFDAEGRLLLQMKKPDGPYMKAVGHSPDEADSLVLAVHGMLHPEEEMMAGGF